MLVQEVSLTLPCSTSLGMCDLPCSVRCRAGSWVRLERPSEAERVQARATISRADAAPMGACPVRMAFVQLCGRARTGIMDLASTPSQRLIRVFRRRGIFREIYMWAARRHHRGLGPRQSNNKNNKNKNKNNIYKYIYTHRNTLKTKN